MQPFANVLQIGCYCKFLHRCFPVNVLKYLKKTFHRTPPLAASENAFEEFLRISKGGLTWNDCMI